MRQSIHTIPALAATSLLLICANADAYAQPHAGRAADDWWRNGSVFQSAHYDVRTDLDRALAEELARHMDSMFEHYGQVLSGLRVRRTLRLELLLFRSPGDYMATLDHRYNARPAGTGGLCMHDGSRVTLAAWVGNQPADKVKLTLQHEGFHQVARSLLGDIPLWADEGLAEVCESAVIIDGRVIFGEIDAAHVSLLRQAESRGALMPLRTLFNLDSEDWTDAVNVGRGALPYAQAWSVVHFLLYADDGRFQDEFDEFMSKLNRGQSWEGAFHRVFLTTDFDALEQSWRAYLPTLTPVDFRETLRRLEFLAEGMLALRAKGIQPGTFDDLKTGLRELGFTHQARRLGDVQMLKAGDDMVFAVPGEGESASGAAIFELVAPQAQPDTDRKKKKGERDRRPAKPKGGSSAPNEAPLLEPAATGAPPLPPTIATKNLKPMDLAVTWEIDEKTGALSYRLGLR